MLKSPHSSRSDLFKTDIRPSHSLVKSPSGFPLCIELKSKFVSSVSWTPLHALVGSPLGFHQYAPLPFCFWLVWSVGGIYGSTGTWRAMKDGFPPAFSLLGHTDLAAPLRSRVAPSPCPSPLPALGSCTLRLVAFPKPCPHQHSLQITQFNYAFGFLPELWPI